MSKLRHATIVIVTFAALEVSASIQFEGLNDRWSQAFQIIFIFTIAWFLNRLVAVGRELLE